MIPWGALGVPWGAFLDFDETRTSLRANGLKVQSLPSKYSLAELTCVTRVIEPIPGNGTNRAVPDQCSTRAWGKDDGS